MSRTRKGSKGPGCPEFWSRRPYSQWCATPENKKLTNKQERHVEAKADVQRGLKDMIEME